MQDYDAFRVSICKALILVIFNGLYVALADTGMVVLKAGSSLDLPFNNPIESDLSVRWRFNRNIFVEYSTDRNYTFLNSQFSGRLKEISNRVGVTVQDLQHQDSGTFSVVADSYNRQYETQIFNIYVQSPINSVHIEKSQSWPLATNSCDVDIKCAAPGAENVSYIWSGYKTASGSQLQFSLSTADGAITLNCTAANNVSSRSATETLICEQPKTSAIPLYIWIATAGGGLLLLIGVIAVLIYCSRSHKDIIPHEGGNTVYADVDINSRGSGQINKRSDSVVNGMTVYETVADLRTNPEMTIYAKVTLPQQAKVTASTSSPYQQVL